MCKVIDFNEYKSKKNTCQSNVHVDELSNDFILEYENDYKIFYAELKEKDRFLYDLK